MKHFLLIYDLTDAYPEGRAAYRDEHLALGWAAHERGELVVAGAFNPPEKGLYLFKVEDPAVVERFAEADPYVKNGLVSSWRVQEWSTVIGDIAANPVRPAPKA